MSQYNDVGNDQEREHSTDLGVAIAVVIDRDPLAVYQIKRILTDEQLIRIFGLRAS